MLHPNDTTHLIPEGDEPTFLNTLSLKLPYRMEGTASHPDAANSGLAVLHELESAWMKKVPFMDTDPFAPIIAPRPLHARSADSLAMNFPDRQKSEQYNLRAAAQGPVQLHAHRPALAMDGPPLDSVDFSACFPYDSLPCPVGVETVTRLVDSIRSQCTAPLHDPSRALVTLVAGHKGAGKSTLLPPLLLYAFRHLSMQSGCPDAQLCRTVLLVCQSTAACALAAQRIQAVLAAWGVSAVGHEAAYHETFPYQQSFAVRKPRTRVLVHSEGHVSAALARVDEESPECSILVCTPGVCMGYLENMAVDERSKQTNAARWASSLVIVDDADAAGPDGELLLWMLRDMKAGSGAPRRHRRVRLPVVLLAHTPVNAQNDRSFESERIGKLSAFFEQTDPLRGMASVSVRCEMLQIPSRFQAHPLENFVVDEEAEAAGGLNVMDLESEDEEGASIPPLLPVEVEAVEEERQTSATRFSDALTSKIPLLSACAVWDHADIANAFEKDAEFQQNFAKLCENASMPAKAIVADFAIPLTAHLHSHIEQKGPILVVLPSDSAVAAFCAATENESQYDTMGIQSNVFIQFSKETTESSRRVIALTHDTLRGISRHTFDETPIAAVVDTCRVEYDTSIMRSENDLPVVEADVVSRCTRWASLQETSIVAELLCPLSSDSAETTTAKPIFVCAVGVSIERPANAQIPLLPRALLPQAVLRIIAHLSKSRNDLNSGLPQRIHPVWHAHSVLSNLPLSPAPTSFAVSAALGSLHMQGLLCLQSKPARADHSSEEVESVFAPDSAMLLSLSAFGLFTVGLWRGLPHTSLYVRIAVTKLLWCGVVHRCVLTAAVAAAVLVADEAKGATSRSHAAYTDCAQKAVFWRDVCSAFLQLETVHAKKEFCAKKNVAFNFVEKLIQIAFAFLRVLCECGIFETATAQPIEGLSVGTLESEYARSAFNSHILTFDADAEKFSSGNEPPATCAFAVVSDSSGTSRKLSVQHITKALSAVTAETPAEIEMLRHMLVLAMYPNVCALRNRGDALAFGPLSGEQIIFQKRFSTETQSELLEYEKRDFDSTFASRLPPDGSLLAFTHRVAHNFDSSANDAFATLSNATAAAPLSILLAASNMSAAEVSTMAKVDKRSPPQCSHLPMHRGWYALPKSPEKSISESTTRVGGTIISHAYSEAQQTLYPLMQYVLTLDSFIRVVAGDKQTSNMMMLLHLMHLAAAYERLCAPLEIASTASQKAIDRKAMEISYVETVRALLAETAQRTPEVRGVPMEAVQLIDPFESFLNVVQGKDALEADEGRLQMYSTAVSAFTPTSYRSLATVSPEETAMHIPKHEFSSRVIAFQKAVPLFAVITKSLLTLMDRTAMYLLSLPKRSAGALFFERIADDKAFSFLRHASVYSPAVHRMYSFVYQKRLEASLTAKRLEREVEVGKEHRIEKEAIEAKDEDSTEAKPYTAPMHILLAYALTQEGSQSEGKRRAFCLEGPELNTILRFCDADFVTRCMPSLFLTKKRFLPVELEGFVQTEEGDERKKTNALISAGLLKLTPEIRAAFEGDSKETREAAVSRNMTDSAAKEGLSRERHETERRPPRDYADEERRERRSRAYPEDEGRSRRYSRRERSYEEERDRRRSDRDGYRESARRRR